jgi:glycosyl transferase family 25
VISVADAMGRRSAFQEAAKASPIEWSFSDAHTQPNPALSYDPQMMRRQSGRELLNAEQAVYSSHFALWQWLIDAPCEQMIVLEDDIVVDWPFLEALSRIQFQRQGIEYLRMFAKVPSPWRYVKSPYFDWYRHLIRFTGYPLGTQAYLLSKRGAAKLIGGGRQIRAPVDVFMDQSWQHGLPNLAVYPFPVFERYQPSSIGEERLRPNRAGHAMPWRSKVRTYVRRKLRLGWSVYGPEPPAVRRLKRALQSQSIQG